MGGLHIKQIHYSSYIQRQLHITRKDYASHLKLAKGDEESGFRV